MTQSQPVNEPVNSGGIGVDRTSCATCDDTLFVENMAWAMPIQPCPDCCAPIEVLQKPLDYGQDDCRTAWATYQRERYQAVRVKR